MKNQNYFKLILLLSVLFALRSNAQGPINERMKERKFYGIKDVGIPADVILEVGGMDFISDGRLAVCTRRGEIWILDDAYQLKSKTPTYTKFASGLHEPLGLAYHEGSIYVNQRSELTKITDTDKDGKADLFQTICTWPISGNYHEYAYGPLFLKNGDMLVTLNLSWIGRAESLTKWRGWMLKVTPDGKVIPFAAGMRSPAGFGFNSAGDIFFAENQGDWISSGRITHIEQGDFAGHPASLNWSNEKDSPLKDLKRDQFPDSIGSMFEFGKQIPHMKQPAVIFPHTLMGISTSAVTTIPSGFGPFEGQLLVGDQGHSKIMRAYLEKVNGKYQGACFPFLEGFSSGVLRLLWGMDHTLFVGMTSRGWASTGQSVYGLQRVTWSGSIPFEIKAMKATSDGFDIEFTKPIDKKNKDYSSLFKITGFTYVYHKKYGSPVVDQKDCPVSKADVSADGLSVKLHVSGLREGYVHQLDVTNLKSSGGETLLHKVAYYTLNAIPKGSSNKEDKANGQAEHMDHHAVKDEKGQGGCGVNTSKNVTTMPVSWGKGPDVQIIIGTKPGLKFDKELIEVREGSKVKLIFNNNDDMLHNLLITKKDKGQEVGELALQLGLKGTELGFIPESTNLLWNTCLLQPETSQAIYFVAPAAGEYAYLCSYPGHYLVMKGIMKVLPKK